MSDFSSIGFGGDSSNLFSHFSECSLMLPPSSVQDDLYPWLMVMNEKNTKITLLTLHHSAAISFEAQLIFDSNWPFSEKQK